MSLKFISFLKYNNSWEPYLQRNNSLTFCRLFESYRIPVFTFRNKHLQNNETDYRIFMKSWPHYHPKARFKWLLIKTPYSWIFRFSRNFRCTQANLDSNEPIPFSNTNTNSLSMSIHNTITTLVRIVLTVCDILFIKWKKILFFDASGWRCYRYYEYVLRIRVVTYTFSKKGLFGIPTGT